MRNLYFLLKLLFTFSDGQSSVEIGLSIKKAISKDNIEQTSVTSPWMM